MMFYVPKIMLIYHFSLPKGRQHFRLPREDVGRLHHRMTYSHNDWDLVVEEDVLNILQNLEEPVSGRLSFFDPRFNRTLLEFDALLYFSAKDLEITELTEL